MAGNNPSTDNNFFRQFRDKNTRTFIKFTAELFLSVWNHYDQDGNGYIEGEELDGFLREFIASVNTEDLGPEVLSPAALKELREEFMAAYDENGDNRIEMGELAEILPTEENFLLLFRRDNPLDSSVEFMKTWRKFDKDNSGYIENDELQEFLEHLLREAKPLEEFPADRLVQYTKTILELFDRNNDGKLQLSEMARLLPVKENFLVRPLFKHTKRLTPGDIDRVFRKYDANRSGTIENIELQGFLKDLLELTGEEYDDIRMKSMLDSILKQFDANGDGKIERGELRMFLLQQKRIAEEMKIAQKTMLDAE